jgi:hypothetical protein
LEEEPQPPEPPIPPEPPEPPENTGKWKLTGKIAGAIPFSAIIEPIKEEKPEE